MISDVSLCMQSDKQNSQAAPLRILIVEDNAINMRVTQLQLRRLGYETDIAKDGVEALEKAKINRFDAILMDCHLPKMDGFETTRQIRLLPDGKDTAIIALTASIIEDDRHKCLDAGMNDFLSKPVNVDELARVLSSIFKKKQESVLG